LQQYHPPSESGTDATQKYDETREVGVVSYDYIDQIPEGKRGEEDNYTICPSRS